VDVDAANDLAPFFCFFSSFSQNINNNTQKEGVVSLLDYKIGSIRVEGEREK
jgi:hypothetical protein